LLNSWHWPPYRRNAN